MKTINDIVEYLAYDKTKLDEFKSIIIEVTIIDDEYRYNSKIISYYINLIKSIIYDNIYFMYNNIQLNIDHILLIFEYIISDDDNDDEDYLINVFNFQDLKDKIIYYYKVLRNNYEKYDYTYWDYKNINIDIKILDSDSEHIKRTKRIVKLVQNTIIDDKIVEETINILNTFPFVDITLRYNDLLEKIVIIEKTLNNKIYLLEEVNKKLIKNNKDLQLEILDLKFNSDKNKPIVDYESIKKRNYNLNKEFNHIYKLTKMIYNS
jgi:hypothetical protein